jgi:ferredoxin
VSDGRARDGTVSRRGLLSLFTRPARAQVEEKKESFSLAGFYTERATRATSTATSATIPVFRVRDGGIPVATTSVGVDELGGVARVRPTTCLAYVSFCSTCVERCPVPGAILVELGRPRVVEDVCTGCGACVRACPSPDNGFEVVPRVAS